MIWDKTRKVGEEVSRWYIEWIENGMMDKYLSGDATLDIGSVGYLDGTTTYHDNAENIDFNTPGYDGINIPKEDESIDAILASHILEHVPTENVSKVLQEWLRVLKTNKYMVITVPHQYAYEKKKTLPSRYNGDHKRFYTPSVLLKEVETALEPNTYRVELVKDNINDYNRNIPPERHGNGPYEVLLIIQKIEPYPWSLDE